MAQSPSMPQKGIPVEICPGSASVVAVGFWGEKRFGVSILNHAVTSSHVHLIMKDPKGRDAIPQTMQLVAGRTGDAGRSFLFI
jgi:hypothetical protein